MSAAALTPTAAPCRPTAATNGAGTPGGYAYARQHTLGNGRPCVVRSIAPLSDVAVPALLSARQLLAANPAVAVDAYSTPVLAAK